MSRSNDYVFRSDAVALPLTRKENDFEQYIASVFGRYVAQVKNMTPADQITDRIQKNATKIKTLCAGVLLSLQSTSCRICCFNGSEQK
jgi:hypothetical protein